jgi:hypothetical protein
VSEDEVVAFRMLVPECKKICGIEIIRGPLALDGCWSLSVGRDDQVIRADDLARAMVDVAVQGTDRGAKVFENRDIRAMVKRITG